MRASQDLVCARQRLHRLNDASAEIRNNLLSTSRSVRPLQVRSRHEHREFRYEVEWVMYDVRRPALSYEMRFNPARDLTVCSNRWLPWAL
jgi:hypothetical protein